ncbi:MAG: transglutaminase family protein, partial [Candidatus Parcubacteria bacterium]|nr:transglutaminase family protein [Burkholderiales bacterium]
MRYGVLHETVYGYESPVVLSQQLLHLTPRVLEFQTLLKHHIVVEPAPAETSTRDDYFGNPVTQILLAAPHARLSVSAESQVEVAARSLPEGGGAWEEVRDGLRR